MSPIFFKNRLKSNVLKSLNAWARSIHLRKLISNKITFKGFWQKIKNSGQKIWGKRNVFLFCANDYANLYFSSAVGAPTCRRRSQANKGANSGREM